MRRRLVSSLAIATLALSPAAASAGSWETADVVGQGLAGPVVAADGASISRGPNSVAARLVMATPENYVYPVGPTGSGEAGHPEAFSLWVFVFFNPEECASAICGPGDLMNNPDVVAGAFNAGGHVTGSSKLSLAGSVGLGSDTFGGPNAETLAEGLAMGFDLADADVHLAVAPHGRLAPELLPSSISTPVGTPAHWWIAIFPPSS